MVEIFDDISIVKVKNHLTNKKVAENGTYVNYSSTCEETEIEAIQNDNPTNNNKTTNFTEGTTEEI